MCGGMVRAVDVHPSFTPPFLPALRHRRSNSLIPRDSRRAPVASHRAAICGDIRAVAEVDGARPPPPVRRVVPQLRSNCVRHTRGMNAAPPGVVLALGALAAMAIAVTAAIEAPFAPLLRIANGDTGLAHWLGGIFAALWQSWTVRIFIMGYCILFATLLMSHRAQTWLIYLHWIRPPTILHRPDDVCLHGLSGVGRSVRAAHLCGWHILPAGPPFAQSEHDFEARLAAPAQRIIVFFHGNSGTRAFPARRVRAVANLAAQFGAHVLCFDYSGFADVPGRPSEAQLYADARAVYEWVRSRTAPDARVVLYGQSLGSFAAVDLAACLSRELARDASDARLAGLVLESAPASLVEAARSHPTVAPFRIVPGIDSVFRNLLKERLDSLGKMLDIVFPLLVMHGDADTFITPEQGYMLYNQAVAGGNENANIVIFPNCGHNNVSASKKYLRTVNDFLDQYAPLP